MFFLFRRLFGRKPSRSKKNLDEDEISELFREYLELERMHHDLCLAYQTAELKILAQKQKVRHLVFMFVKDEFRPTIYRNDFVPTSHISDTNESVICV